MSNKEQVTKPYAALDCSPKGLIKMSVVAFGTGALLALFEKGVILTIRKCNSAQ